MTQVGKVSVVIPTRNRKASLLKALAAVAGQRSGVDEVIVVDSSDEPLDFSEIRARFDFGDVFVIHTAPSVCVQRNEGVRRATGYFILVLDDDNLMEPNYIARCLDFFAQHPAAMIVSGLIVEKNDSGGWDYLPPRISLLRLVWNLMFQLGVWSDLRETSQTRRRPFSVTSIHRYYRNRGNGLSKAGWPVLTCFSPPYFRTRVYYLSAALIKRSWLLANPYAEKLDRHGIGENYGITVGLNTVQGVFILTGTHAFHDKSPENRLAASDAYFKRVLALDYFSTRHKLASRMWLIWSLVGNLLDAGVHLNMDRVVKNCRLIGVLSLNRNPLLR